MKVVILQDYLRAGGTERQSVFLAHCLSEYGYEVQLLTFRPGGVLAASIGNIEHCALQSFDTGFDWLAVGLTRALQDSSPHCILCQGRMANSYAGTLQRRFPHINVISTIRTGKPLSLFYRRSLCKTEHIIVNSDWWRNQLVGQGVKEDRISVVHNPLTFDCSPNQQGQRSRIREKFSVTSTICVFICVQEFRPGKRHVDLIRYFSEFGNAKHWQLWLVGDGKERKKCERLAIQLGIEQQIQFIGFTGDPIPFYAGADVAVSVSKEDSLPNFLIEAQTMGLPVVALDYRGVKEAFLSKHSGFLLSRSESKSFVKTVNRFIQDEPLRKQMGKSAQTFAQQKFSPVRQVEKILKILESVVKAKIPIQPKRIVLSRPDRIGDVVVTTTCFQSIKSSFPEAKVYVIVAETIQPLLSHHPLIKEVIGLSPCEMANSELIERKLNQIQPCCLVHLHFNQKIEKAAKNAGIPYRIGFSSHKAGHGLTSHQPDNKKQCKKHEADYNFDLLNLIGVRNTSTLKPMLFPSLSAKESLMSKCSWLRNLGSYATLHMTAFGKKKTLTSTLFVDVAHWLHDVHGFKIVFVGKEDNHPTFVEVNTMIGDKKWVLNTVARLRLAETAWLLKSSSLTMGRDSGITHISAAIGTPTYTVMIPLGRTLSSRRWRPLGPNTAFYEKQIFPNMFETDSGYQNRYVRNITFDDIKKELDGLLRKKRYQPMETIDSKPGK